MDWYDVQGKRHQISYTYKLKKAKDAMAEIKECTDELRAQGRKSPFHRNLHQQEDRRKGMHGIPCVPARTGQVGEVLLHHTDEPSAS